MIDVSTLIDDPDFALDVTLIRRRGSWQEGRFVPRTEAVPIRAVVRPNYGSDVSGYRRGAAGRKLIPEPAGSRPEGLLVFFTRTEVRLAEGSRASDQLVCRGRVYEAVQVKNWSEHGFWRVTAWELATPERSSP